MNQKELNQIYQAIGALSKKVNDINIRLDALTNMRADENKELAEDAQNATCELSEEVDVRITDLENALCELTEE